LTRTPAEPADSAAQPARLAQQLRHAQKMEAIGQLAAGIAHELNNPLAAILALSHLVGTDRSLPPEIRRHADQLTDEARRTHRLVNALLDFAREKPASRNAASLRAIVARVLELQSAAFSPGRIDAIVEIPDDIPLIPMDRADVEQLVINLTLNAAQAIRTRSERGTVRIVATRIPASRGDSTDIDGFVRLSITDDGPGIAEELWPRLFEPYFTTKSPGTATGLGLAVSRAIAIDHGGTLRHEPGSAGVGSTFVLELPVEVSTPATRLDTNGTTAVPAPAAGATSASDAAASSSPTPPRILIVDDEAAIRDLLARILGNSGFEPVVAADGESALEIVRTNPPAAILCDHRMAGMGGIAFHEAIVAIDPRLALSFAFMSGDVLNHELDEFATTRDILVLAKPFDIEGVTRTTARLVAAGR
jgi:two-component system NtrC family sensor kinase